MGGSGDLDHLEAVGVGVVVVAQHNHLHLRARIRASHVIASHGSRRGVGSGESWIAIDENMVARAMTTAITGARPGVRGARMRGPSPVAFAPSAAPIGLM